MDFIICLDCPAFYLNTTSSLFNNFLVIPIIYSGGLTQNSAQVDYVVDFELRAFGLLVVYKFLWCVDYVVSVVMNVN